MTLTALVRAYLTLHVLLALAWLLMEGLRRLRLLDAQQMLVLARAAIVAAFLLPLLSLPLPRGGWYRPPVQVWFAPTSNAPEAQPTLSSSWTAPAPRRAPMPGMNAEPVAMVVLSLAAAAMAIELARVLLARRRLRAMLARTCVRKRVGRVELRLSAEPCGPFAAYIDGRALVVLDASTFSHGDDARIAVAHELQHHRQWDTRLALPARLLLSTVLVVPLAHLWRRLLEALEEHACDEAVLARGRFDAGGYGRCLLRVAAHAKASAPMLTTLLTPRARRALLTRRILMITDRPIDSSSATRVLVALAAAAVLAAGACAADDLVADYRVPSDRAAAASARASGDGFAVPDNELIGAAINRLAGTPDGRRFAQDALKRLPQHQEMIDRHLGAHGLPKALAAVAFIESGFNNLGAVRGSSLAPGQGGAGIWMFIPATARAYGLRVDPGAGVDGDERLDIEKETDAAARLLADCFAEFGDWGLALAAYNQGSRHVRGAIEAEGTRDPWELARRGALNGYAAQVMAAAAVMADPSLVAEAD